jgi:hypothetical protein
VTIYYHFHPLRTHSLPVVRMYDFHDEVYYVVRRADGRSLAVPAWMTRPEAAYAKGWLLSEKCNYRSAGSGSRAQQW